MEVGVEEEEVEVDVIVGEREKRIVRRRGEERRWENQEGIRKMTSLSIHATR